MRKPATNRAAASLFSATVLATGGAASADVLLEVGGWRIEADASTALDLTVLPLGVDGNVLSLRKIADFNDLNELTGLPDGIVITFTQISDDAGTTDRIVIEDEVLTNNTGVTWTSFVMSLLGDDATFNGALSSSFAAPPLPDAAFDGDTVTFSGGTVPDGGAFMPGLPTGELVIDLNLDQESPVIFSLKELPIPAPAGTSLALLGGCAMLRRRR